MPVTQRQAELLAELAVAMRPHGARQWDATDVVYAVHRVGHLALADVAMAACRAATDRTLTTPATIGEVGSNAWREKVAPPTPTGPRICPEHRAQYRGPACPSCRADQLAGEV